MAQVCLKPGFLVASSVHPAAVDPFGPTATGELWVLAVAGKVKGVKGPPRPALLPKMLPGETTAMGGGMAHPNMPLLGKAGVETVLSVTWPTKLALLANSSLGPPGFNAFAPSPGL